MNTELKGIICACILMMLMSWQGLEAKSLKERPKVGLVLGGGGAKGAATVGVLKYIEQSGIPIDYIAGTSIGSIVGGLYACGYRSEQLDSMFRTQEWMTLLTDRNMDFSGKPIARRNGITYIFGFPVARKHSSPHRQIGRYDTR